MTREEAIAYGKNYYRDLTLACCEIDEKHKGFVRMSLEALEQQPFINKPCVLEGVCREDKIQVLNKIRAEIEDLTYYCWEVSPRTVIDDVLEIIDKHKAESAEWVDDKCSACGKGIEDLIDSSEWYRNKSPRYCPFCGIKIQPYKGESEE